MRSFLNAFACRSTLAMAQNVVLATPTANRLAGRQSARTRELDPSCCSTRFPANWRNRPFG